MKYALIYGLLSGSVIAAVITAGLLLGPEFGFTHSLWFGYLVMLVALTFIFVGVKRYRDVERGGVIKFLPAFGMGLAIAIVAGIAYVCVWEAYQASTGYRFMDEYIAAMVRQRQAEGASAAAIAEFMREMEGMRVSYANPLFRLPMTFLEVFPVGLLVALISAALLRNPRLLPAAR
jgi:cytochrome c-type biogenesis protein CcmH/NrfF